jgi:DNA-binding MarR family transcriptional regulator
MVYIHLMAGAKPNKTVRVLPCTCANLRRAARAVTRAYNQELKAVGIEITQFTLLMALDTTGEIPQGRLGRLLGLDSTTLTRMLDLLKKREWVQAKEGIDRRVRVFSMTRAGQEQFRQARPHWKRAQDSLEKALGAAAVDQLTGILAKVAVISARD